MHEINLLFVDFEKKLRKKYYLFRISVQFLHVVKYLHNKTKQSKTFDYLITGDKCSYWNNSEGT